MVNTLYIYGHFLFIFHIFNLYQYIFWDILYFFTFYLFIYVNENVTWRVIDLTILLTINLYYYNICPWARLRSNDGSKESSNKYWLTTTYPSTIDLCLAWMKKRCKQHSVKDFHIRHQPRTTQSERISNNWLDKRKHSEMDMDSISLQLKQTLK